MNALHDGLGSPINVVFPESQNDPSLGCEELLRPPVPLHVAREFVLPEDGVGRGLNLVLRAAMPKTTVDEDCDAFCRKDNVRPPRKACLRPKPQTAAPERPPDDHFRLGVTATNP